MIRSGVLEIDGSFGEGGGQILRTSLSLSLVTGTPLRIDNIRAGRENPGLLRQHLTAVLAAAEVGGANVEGATLASPCLTFTPGAEGSGEYCFAVGTAGSGTLVLQTVLPALMLASSSNHGPSKVTIEGGTHNRMAPPNAAREAREYLASRAAAGEHLTDQFLLPMAWAGAGSFMALKLNLHARTNMDVIGKLLPVECSVVEHDGWVRISL